MAVTSSGEDLTRSRHHWFYIASLMLAGESIYMLPYMRKTFQTSMESVFMLTSTQVGLLDSMFGVLALACYFPGGWLADRFSARKLLTFSLISSGLGGLYLYTLPGYTGLLCVHAFWGITTILTFWGALIKATRYWGGDQTQGLSFGLLDGGRGLVGALLATLAAAVFAMQQSVQTGLGSVILVYSLAPILAGVVVWFTIPETMYASSSERAGSGPASGPLRRVRQALSVPDLWLLAVVILAAYMLYIGTFEFPAFAERGFGQDKVFGATLGAFRDWMRPIAAVGAGLLADRLTTSRVVSVSFLLLILGYGTLFLVPAEAGRLNLLWGQVCVVAVSAFALRGIYFALLKEIRIPLSLTGIAVGFVSFIGFTPDIFAHLLAGRFVDSQEGSLGYQYYFGFLSLVGVVGLAASLAIYRRARR